MSKKKKEYQPFNQDVNNGGSYQYTNTQKKSAIYSNLKNSQMILNNSGLEGKRVLDVGCGDGTYTNVLYTEGKVKSILGIDPAENAIRVAKDRFESGDKRISFRSCVTDDLLSEGCEFDLVICRGVLHHVGDPILEVKNCIKLAPELFIHEPNGLNIVLKFMEHFSRYHVAHKEQSYSMAQYHEWIDESGGCVEKYGYHGLVPFFCPDTFVSIGRALEPLIESIPIVRNICCGRMTIKVLRKS